MTPLGEMTERIALSRAIVTNDATVGDLSIEWRTYAERWALVVEVGSAESPSAAGQQAATTYDLVCPWCDGVKSTDRVEYRGLTLEVFAVTGNRLEGETLIRAKGVETDDA